MKIMIYIGIILMVTGLALTPSNEEVNLSLNQEYVNTFPDYNIIKQIGPIVFDGMTEYQLIEQINKSLNSTLTNKADLIVPYALELGVDPYLATAIILHETGCTWECSYLLQACNNVGGIKGSPGCNGGSYKTFSSLEAGMNYYIEMLDRWYIELGLTTPELIGPKYAASTSWASKVNNYIYKIKNA